MSRAPLVLIVSEHEWASRSLDTIFAPKGYAVLRAYNGQQALERAAESGPDAIFVERALPDMTANDLCTSLLALDVVSKATPLIVLSPGPTTHEQRLESLRAGAWELITLPVDAEELLLRVDHYIRAKLEADRAQEDALVDPDTGFYSRSGLIRRIRELGAAAERFERPLACIVFAPGPEDDGTGERPGAEEPASTAIAVHDALHEVAALLRGVTRRSDVLGRIGPREFAIVAPDTPPEGAQILAQRLRQSASRGRNGSRAGVFAVANLRQAALDPLEIVLRATKASYDPVAPELN